MFKKDIQPTWDHPGNEKGGRWIINIDKKPNSLDSLWLLVVGIDYRGLRNSGKVVFDSVLTTPLVGYAQTYLVTLGLALTAFQ